MRITRPLAVSHQEMFEATSDDRPGRVPLVLGCSLLEGHYKSHEI